MIDYAGDQAERMADQSRRIGLATLVRYADITHTTLTDMRGTTSPRLMLELLSRPDAAAGRGRRLGRAAAADRAARAAAGHDRRPAARPAAPPAGAGRRGTPGRARPASRPARPAAEPRPHRPAAAAGRPAPSGGRSRQPAEPAPAAEPPRRARAAGNAEPAEAAASRRPSQPTRQPAGRSAAGRQAAPAEPAGRQRGDRSTPVRRRPDSAGLRRLWPDPGPGPRPQPANPGAAGQRLDRGRSTAPLIRLAASSALIAKMIGRRQQPVGAARGAGRGGRRRLEDRGRRRQRPRRRRCRAAAGQPAPAPAGADAARRPVRTIDGVDEESDEVSGPAGPVAIRGRRDGAAAEQPGRPTDRGLVTSASRCGCASSAPATSAGRRPPRWCCGSCSHEAGLTDRVAGGQRRHRSLARRQRHGPAGPADAAGPRLPAGTGTWPDSSAPRTSTSGTWCWRIDAGHLSRLGQPGPAAPLIRPRLAAGSLWPAALLRPARAGRRPGRARPVLRRRPAASRSC